MPSFYGHRFEVPDEFQYMPPGLHRINPQWAHGEITVEVTEKAAENLNYFCQFNRKKSMLISTKPFFDIEHDCQVTVAYPIEFRWAGDKPDGGVRVRVHWTPEGRELVGNGIFKYFSPTFMLGPDKAIYGTNINMGGIVNRKAFIGIQPIIAEVENFDEQWARLAFGGVQDVSLAR